MPVQSPVSAPDMRHTSVRTDDGLWQPAYNLTIDYDHCYFVRGDDGRAYLVANSSHGAKAFATLAYFAASLQRGVKGGAYATVPDDNGDRRAGMLTGKGLGWMRAIVWICLVGSYVV